MGFTVTAVDFAEGAVAEMHRLAEPGADVTVLQADIFALPESLHGGFDYVIDYTCYCAVDPARRPDYVEVADRLLRPGGQFISLVFPIGDYSGGPPFAVRPQDLIARFGARGYALLRREIHPDTIAPRKGREELVILEKPAERM